MSGGNGFEEVLVLDEGKTNTIIQAFAELQNRFDVMIVDIAAGADHSVLNFISLSSSESLELTNPRQSPTLMR